uniref:Uncharacterized protein n=1 Tax=Chlamydomonas chlamydogama TaxID=225041 RepID=A0A7S2VVT2_9CHLO|mmetsp:Transcript_2008/g.4435  ORF Transcript_2008/g.4435 Transcript_2008/m.4435 type:complete len:918 (+) Transcript_2008:257-3010(+)
MANPWDLQLVEVIQTAAGDDLDWRRTAVKALGNASDLEKVDIITAHSKRPSLAKDIIDKAIADYNGGHSPDPAPSTVRLSQDEVVHSLVQQFGKMFATCRKRGVQLKRNGSIPIPQGQVLLEFGQYLALAGYEGAVDELITVLLLLQHNFTASGNEGFEGTEQLLRLAGAPGIGKTTFASAAWDLVMPRMKQLQESHSQMWTDWKREYDPQELLKRLQASWSGQHGPLVFTMDMSQKDYRKLHNVEATEGTEQQVAARMLWAALDTSSAGILNFEAFLLALKSAPQPLLQSLTPEIVQRFVLQAAGVPNEAASTIVWVWDEVNAIQLLPGQEVTFCQQHLSEAVIARMRVQLERHKGGLDVLPVLVACTTRGSSTSLGLTASKKARVLDLQVPLREELQVELPLVVMDLFRRLDPPPCAIASQLQTRAISGSASLSQLTAEQRQALANLCPQHVRNALEWAGGNVRSATHLLGALSGQPEGRTQHLQVGSFEWWDAGKSRPLGEVVNMLVNRMEQAGWDRWLSTDGPNYPLLVRLVAHCLCNVPLQRSSVLQTKGGDITVEQLERDGVVQLVSMGKHLEVAEQPDMMDKRVVLPPALLAAYLRRVQRPPGKSGSPTLKLVQGMIEASRVREHDDLTITLLRLQMFGDVMDRKALQLDELLPSLTGTSVGATLVKIPETGFLPSLRGQDLPQGRLQQLVEAAVASASEPWCWLLGGSCGPDSWMVLRKSDSGGQCTSGCIVLHLQSKLTERDAAFTWDKVLAEVQKVQPTNPKFDATEVLAIITDHRPPKRHGHRPGSGGNRGSGSSSGNRPSTNKPWQELVEGRPVHLDAMRMWVTVVFREQQWQVRGGAALLYDLLRLGSDMASEQHLPQGGSPYDHPMLLAQKTGRPGRPKLMPRPDAIHAWQQWEDAHNKKQKM